MAKLAKLRTYLRLGLSNLFHVALYRLKIKRGAFKALLPINDKLIDETTPFFIKTPSRNHDKTFSPFKLFAFGWIEINTDSPPNWLKAVNSEQTITSNEQHWSQLNDFDQNVGDIKTVWELSRFHWLLFHAVNAIDEQDDKNLSTLNQWLSDWCVYNPINQGVNWKCGQEASIRVMHIAATAFILNQEENLSDNLAKLIHAHLCRIYPTVHYAMAQDNNHGTSEAAALYIGALLLENTLLYQDESQISVWKESGEYWLENRAKQLIATDGAFSQHSINYHRLMLDTLSLTEFFRQRFQQPAFSQQYLIKVKAAIDWLAIATSSDSGKAAILGLNDGAQLVPLTTCGYTDFRPSIHWASSLFSHIHTFENQQEVTQLSRILPPSTSQKNEESASTVLPNKLNYNSSYHAIEVNNAKCIMRTPNNKFRPSSCDALHIDFWVDNENIFIGTGSYSYNCEPALQAYFTSVKSHNTVQFDNHEQMPKLSRFLYNHWLKVNVHSVAQQKLVASYQNYLTHKHQRVIELSNQSLTVSDEISHFKDSATLRWHLPNKPWQLQNNILSHDGVTVAITANVPIIKIALVDGYQSRYYLKKEKIAVLEVSISQPGSIQTIVNWS